MKILQITPNQQKKIKASLQENLDLLEPCLKDYSEESFAAIQAGLFLKIIIEEPLEDTHIALYRLFSIIHRLASERDQKSFSA